MPPKARFVPVPAVKPEEEPPAPETTGHGKKRYAPKGKERFKERAAPAAKRAVVAPPPPPTTQRFALQKVLLVPFSARDFVPDFGGLLLLAHFIWVRYATSRPTSNVVRSFSESMFVFTVAQFAFLILARKCRDANTLQESYMDQVWFMTALDMLVGRRVPKFLADWAAMIGRFSGPNGAILRPNVVEPQPGDATMRMDHSYATSFPIFRLLSRIMANDAANRPWNNFLTNPAAAPGPANPPLIDDIEYPKYPGLHAGMIGANAYVRGNVGGIQDWEYLPAAGQAPTLRHSLQMNASSAAATYLDTLFTRMADEGLPTVVLDATILSVNGTQALCHYIDIENNFPWNEFRIKTLLSDIDPVHAELARLFKPIILKDMVHVEFPAEVAAGRWDTCLVNEDMAAIATPLYSNSEYLNDAREAYAVPP